MLLHCRQDVSLAKGGRRGGNAGGFRSRRRGHQQRGSQARRGEAADTFRGRVAERREHGFAGDYDVWLATRKDDLDAAQQQVESLVESIQTAAKSYHGTDSEARDAFLKALDSSFERIDR
jgi:hypothetical protein